MPIVFRCAVSVTYPRRHGRRGPNRKTIRQTGRSTRPSPKPQPAGEARAAAPPGGGGEGEAAGGAGALARRTEGPASVAVRQRPSAKAEGRTALRQHASVSHEPAAAHQSMIPKPTNVAIALVAL